MRKPRVIVKTITFIGRGGTPRRFKRHYVSWRAFELLCPSGTSLLEFTKSLGFSPASFIYWRNQGRVRFQTWEKAVRLVGRKRPSGRPSGRPDRPRSTAPDRPRSTTIQ